MAENAMPLGMTEDQHLWACASTILKQHGELAPTFVADRIGALALQGDQAGVAIWKAIAERLDKLMREPNARQ